MRLKKGLIELIRISVGPEQDWTGALELRMGSSKSNSIAIAAKNRVWKQRSIIDEAVRESAKNCVWKQRSIVDKDVDDSKNSNWFIRKAGD